jgi:hypothetical protein
MLITLCAVSRADPLQSGMLDSQTLIGSAVCGGVAQK